MKVVRADEAVPYDPPGHRGVDARRLQQLAGLTVSVSTYEQGGAVTELPTAADTVYVVLAGTLRVTSHDDGACVDLGVHDSVFLRAGETRSVVNVSDADAVLLVVLGGAP
ncbi:cupin domain-containing protein [Amycolatopsis sp. NPDC006131]|uniref:cupin domain-containing protein n=1 Tax=Amycolatopsis sp. NPDC006131 TaxID=3156731 RepID=UPI0033BB87A4